MGEDDLRLTVTGPSGATAGYRLAGGRVRIGRDPSCDLVLDDGEMSRFHAEIVREYGAWSLRDSGSRNGTRKNGRTIDEPVELRRGDEIGVGNTLILFDAAPEEVAGRRTTRLAAKAGGAGAADEPPRIVGTSAPIVAVLDTVRRVASSSCAVLVLGENGTGKELVARLLHDSSPRRRGPYVVVNCPALPGALLESELFGVERGVATGVDARPGKFETADGGTLVLDEVGDLDPAAQAKLLRVLETKTVERIGGRVPTPIDVRIVASTNHDLEADVAAGKFRRDLYHRLDTVAVRLPPLRERRGDLAALVAYFVGRSARPDAAFTPAALGALAAYAFPGNVRELAHVVERACLLAPSAEIGPESLPDAVRGLSASTDGRPSDVYRRVVEDGESFWDAVATPYLRREVSREEVARFVAAARTASGGSYKSMARLLRIEDEYKRLLNFLNHHRF